MTKFGEWVQRALGRSDVYFAGSLYMRRWRFLNTPWFGLRLHHIVRSDADRELHDHPFTFVSLILTGGYREHTLDRRSKRYPPGSVVVRSAEALHRLELEVMKHYADSTKRVERAAWTLVVRGPYRRQWGFLTADGWLHWKTFSAARKGDAKTGARPFDAESSEA